MPRLNPAGAATIAGHSIHRALAPFPIAFFGAALCTDAVYWRTADPQWSTMSSWLLLIGLVVAGVAILPGLFDFIRDRSVRRTRPAWGHTLAGGLGFALAALNFVFHVRDGYSAVVPAGPFLSAVVVLILLVVAATGWDPVLRPCAAHQATQDKGV